jgi:hypothetical protein
VTFDWEPTAAEHQLSTEGMDRLDRRRRRLGENPPAKIRSLSYLRFSLDAQSEGKNVFHYSKQLHFDARDLEGNVWNSILTSYQS